MLSLHDASLLLRGELAKLSGYEEAKMAAVPEPLPGLGVFPGGSGVIDPVDLMPDGSRGDVGPRVMVIANDYYTLDGYQELRTKRVGENKSDVFWRSLELLLGDAGVSLDSCFFTNAIMGLRLEKAVTGASQGFKNRSFRAACGHFFVKQVEIVRPSVVLTLGAFAPRVIAPVCQGMERLRSWPGYAKLDENGLALFEKVKVGPTAVDVSAVALLVHPSLRPPNIWRRRFNDFAGHDAEVQLVRRAMSIAREGQTRAAG